jgi:hypothetical protein
MVKVKVIKKETIYFKQNGFMGWIAGNQISKEEYERDYKNVNSMTMHISYYKDTKLYFLSDDGITFEVNVKDYYSKESIEEMKKVLKDKYEEAERLSNTKKFRDSISNEEWIKL